MFFLSNGLFSDFFQTSALLFSLTKKSASKSFADLISKTVSLENKRNKTVFEFVKSQRGRVKRGVIATMCIFKRFWLDL